MPTTLPPFVSSADLESLIAEAGRRERRLVIADVRWYLDGRSGRDAYHADHIAGAVFVDLDEWLAGPPSPTEGRHPLPDPERFARGMTEAGVGDDSTVVAYDDAGGVIAARLAWMLRVLGRDAAVLDGGITAWQGELGAGAAVAGRRAAPRADATFTAAAWPASALASIDETQARAADGSALVLDARTADRFAGETEPVDARAGHIPGARNLSVRDHIGGDGRLRDLDELRARFAQFGLAPGGAAPGSDVIAYCGSGVTACHELLVLEHAGLGRGRLFAGSWSQYAADAQRPLATGA
ncbi:sulfurtransferase [Microcella alkalica]|uniref:Thiosulfate/3-mercaptopyruvate sulfurtransferase n=1 Tax=Microcella alkalica TaxID=355930 RepID=A0A839EB36_9MICO|nr:sulfurtransferase [Microcella alkalica]MBA8848677.1 thiosulfate/3-mercaptopyruvate sulfurtransferase [Microcella alkalica]